MTTAYVGYKHDIKIEISDPQNSAFDATGWTLFLVVTQSASSKNLIEQEFTLDGNTAEVTLDAISTAGIYLLGGRLTDPTTARKFPLIFAEPKYVVVVPLVAADESA